MNILIVVKRFDYGGSQNHACDLANSLSERNHNVYLVGARGRQEERLSDKVNYSRLNFDKFFILYNIIYLVILICRKKIDIIHGHIRFSMLLSVIAGFLTGRKVVVTVHGNAQHDLDYRLVRKHSNKIIHVSRTIMRQGIQKFGLEEKSVLIPNGISTKPIERKPTPYRVYHISRIDRYHYRFLKLMIDSVVPDLIKKYPNFEFHIVGDGLMMQETQSMVKDINQRLKKNCCKLLGYRSDIITLHKDASLVIGVGRVAIEALASGAPVISANCSRMGGLITLDNYDTLKTTNFVDVNSSAPSAKTIHDTIVNFFSDIRKWEEETKSISTKVHDHFSMDSVAKRTEAVYAEIIND